MVKLALALLLTAAATAPVPANTPCLRVMTPGELAADSVIIARARVVDVDESDWGEYGEIATLELEDVIEGDFTIKEVRVGARSHVACAFDRYRKKEEWLVFLEQDGGLYHTINFQNGQFPLQGDIVRGWRNADGVAVEKPYYSVRQEIESIVTAIRNPPVEVVEPVPAVAPTGSAPAAPGTAPAPAPGAPARPTGRNFKKETINHP